MHNTSVKLSNKISRLPDTFVEGIMAVFKRDFLLCLALLVSSAEATNFSDPIICYVLDAVLLCYCIIFTALYFKLKFEKTKMVPDKSPNTGQTAAEEEQYQTLVGQSNDDYQEIQKKGMPRGKGKAAEAIEMKPVPPLPTRD